MQKLKQPRGFIGRLSGLLLKTGLPLIGNVLNPLARSVLIPLGLTAAASATDAAVHKKFGSGNTTLIISNEEMNDIMKIVKALEESGLLVKGVSKTIKNEAKEKKETFSSMLLGTLGVSLFAYLLAGKGTIRAGKGTIRAREGTVRAGTNFEIQKYYQNEPKFNGVYSRNNLPKIKDGVYGINLDEFKRRGTHWIAFYVNANNIIYFDSFGVEHIPKEITKFIGNKNVKENIYRILAYDSMMCKYFYIGFIDFMLKGRSYLSIQICFLLMNIRRMTK